MTARPVVALVGRPNVGKSSLFNRLLGRRKALVQDEPGVTRDRNYAIAEMEGRELILCDTGGFEEQGIVAQGEMARLIREQALSAIAEADVLVFVMDVRAGLTAGDEEIAARLRTASQPVLHVLNKSDQPGIAEAAVDFWRLGAEQLLGVSAEHGLGIDDLIDAIVEALPATPRGLVDEPLEVDVVKARKRSNRRLRFYAEDMPEEAVTRRGPTPSSWDPQDLRGEGDDDGDVLFSTVIDDDGAVVHQAVGWADRDDGGELPADFEAPSIDDFVPRIALLGRPNVGKSTLLNRLLGYQRSITSPIAGTTHDTVDAAVEHDGRRYILIDTAGIRKKARVARGIEALTVGRTLRTVEAAHLCVLMVDGVEGVTEQEAKLGAVVERRGRGLVIVVNKWDQAGGGDARERVQEQVRRRFPHLAFADVVFLSALTGKGVHKLWQALARADEGHRLTVRTAPLNRWARAVWETTPPPMHNHRPVRMYYCAQSGVRPPTFTLFCNQPQAIPESYRRFLQNQLRAAFPATGSPMRLVFRDRAGGDGT